MNRRFLSVTIYGLALAAAPSAALGAQTLGAQLQEARKATTAGDHATALRIVDSLAKANPERPNVVLARAIALGAAGRMSDAESVVRKLMRWDARYARSALRDSALASLRDR